MLDYSDTQEVIVYGDIPDSCDLSLRVNGGSMEPRYPDGQMVVATLNGEIFVKTIRINRHGCELVSLNKKTHPD